MLESFGYTVILKENGKDVLDFIKLEKKNIAAMIFDLTIPGGMGGKEVIGEIRKICSELPVFVASGYAEDPVMAEPASFGFTASICKPFTKAQLAEMLNKHRLNI
jgi:two-component system, cell cycle sensor histidine kinase and response regulator CckA